MTINQRIKEVRRQAGLNQTDFGERIKLKHGAISKLEQDGNTVTDQNIHIICEAFDVSERWLRTGEGEMHVSSRHAYIKKLAQQYQVGAAHAGLIEAFLNLTDAQRDSMLTILRQMVDAADAAIEESTESAIDREVDAYRQELEAQAKEQSLFDGTKGTKEA